MKIDAEQIGEGLRAIRGKAGLKDFSREIGVSIAHLSRLENDLTPPSWNVMLKYARISGRNLQIAFKGKDHAKRTETFLRGSAGHYI